MKVHLIREGIKIEYICFFKKTKKTTTHKYVYLNSIHNESLRETPREHRSFHCRLVLLLHFYFALRREKLEMGFILRHN